MLVKSRHEAAVRFQGDLAEALGMGIHALTANGFRLTRRDDRAAEFTGPGLMSTKQNPLLGASRVVLQGSSGSLKLDAELGGLRRLTLFLYIFPPVLAVVLFLVLTFVPGEQDRSAPPLLALSPVLLWLVLSPAIVFWQRRRTVRALDDLLASMAVAGRRG